MAKEKILDPHVLDQEKMKPKNFEVGCGMAKYLMCDSSTVKSFGKNKRFTKPRK